MFDPSELDKAMTSIDALVEIQPRAKSAFEPITFAQKLDRLSELIDALRYHIGFPVEANPLRVFRPKGIFADPAAGRIYFVDSTGPVEGRDDQAAGKLSMPLLDFLFTHPDSRRKVFTTIRAFIRAYLPQCRMIDFQRTATGVLRIETNVRLAARQLRRHGLLQYTHTEAYKTWRLSLLGILVADEFSSPTLIAAEQPPKADWGYMMFRRLQIVKTLPARVQRLENLVKTSKIDVNRRDDFLQKTMVLLGEYFKILRDMESLSHTSVDRLNAASKIEKLLKALNSSPEAIAVVDAFNVRQTEDSPGKDRFAVE